MCATYASTIYGMQQTENCPTELELTRVSVGLTACTTTTYRTAGKFGGNLIWRIGSEFKMADFNLAVWFSRAMTLHST